MLTRKSLTNLKPTYMLAILRYALIFLLSCFSVSFAFAQQTMEYGIGIGVHYGDYSEDIIFESDIQIPEIDKARILPSIQLRTAYILNERWKISINPSIILKGANDVFGAQRYTGYNVDFPLLAHFKIWNKVHFMAGPSYSHVAYFTIEQDGQKSDVTNSIPERNILAGVLGLAFDVNQHIEVNLTANADVNEAIIFGFTNDFGEPIGNINLRNQYISLAVILRK